MAFDPGTTTGWAQLNERGECQMLGQFSPKELDEWAVQVNPGDIQVLVYEQYIIYPTKKYVKINVGRTRSPADEAIGVILLGGRRAGAKVVKQPANIKETAEKWSGVSPAGMAHNRSHQIDALNHGIYYMVKNKLIQIPSLTRNKESPTSS
jgi:hypothetical protein